jgi:deoxycytidine triphosphate deaminase
MIPPIDGVYFNTPGVASVRWDEDDQFVFVEWDGWANSTEFDALLEAEIQALKQHHSSRLLADCRRQKVLHQKDQDRANREWLPRALAAGLKRFAIVLPESVVAEMNVRDSLDKASGTGLEVGYFATVDEAREWVVA